ncbi:MAG: hypothetical protein Q9214_003574, partial [Letrouitia sp. 1 TL-2023]
MDWTNNNFQHQGFDKQPAPASDSKGHNIGNTQRRNSQSSFTICAHNNPNPQYPSQLSNHRSDGYTSNVVPTPSQEQPANYQPACVPNNDFALDSTFNTSVSGFPPTNQPNQQSLSNPIDNSLRNASYFGGPTLEDPFLVQPYETQTARHFSNISQSEPHQQMKVGNNFRHGFSELVDGLNLSSASSATNPSFPLTHSTSSSKNKKRKLKDNSRGEVYLRESAENMQGYEHILRLTDSYIPILCCIWHAANPSKTPETSDYVLIGTICSASKDDVKNTFESIQNRDMRPGQNSPNTLSSLAAKLWLCRNPGKTPPDQVLANIETLFHSPYENIRRYAVRNVIDTNNTRDSTINKSLHTTMSLMKETPSHAGEPQIP